MCALKANSRGMNSIIREGLQREPLCIGIILTDVWTAGSPLEYDLDGQ